jgi:cyclic pyranopterin phosphate synthase
MKKLSHYDEAGQARMVDISAKSDTVRAARARAFVRMKPEVLQALPQNPKGDPLEVARVAGILAAKRTWELIPMCHPLLLRHVGVDLKIQQEGIEIEASARVTGPTGVEMEALMAASVAALTLYDMTKALDPGTVIERIELVEKTGGKSGAYRKGAGR